MYHSLAGQLVEKTPTSVVLEVNGVGYQVLIPVGIHERLPEIGQNVRLLTHFVVREDAQVLYGFLTESERRLFRLLISVSGVGPKMAMNILSGLPLPELKKAIVEGSVTSLNGIAGIGKKTAERLIVELREKLVLEDQYDSAPSLSDRSTGERLVEDSVQALVALGYRKPHAKTAVQKALKSPTAEKMSVEDLIRLSLKYVE